MRVASAPASASRRPTRPAGGRRRGGRRAPARCTARPGGRLHGMGSCKLRRTGQRAGQARQGRKMAAQRRTGAAAEVEHERAVPGAKGRAAQQQVGQHKAGLPHHPAHVCQLLACRGRAGVGRCRQGAGQGCRWLAVWDRSLQSAKAAHAGTACKQASRLQAGAPIQAAARLSGWAAPPARRHCPPRAGHRPAAAARCCPAGPVGCAAPGRPPQSAGTPSRPRGRRRHRHGAPAQAAPPPLLPSAGGRSGGCSRATEAGLRPHTMPFACSTCS